MPPAAPSLGPSILESAVDRHLPQHSKAHKAAKARPMIARYSRPEMQGLWDDAAIYASWLEVELAAAEAMAVRGTVPADAMEQLRAAQPPDAARVLEIERRTHHDVIAFLEAIEEQVGPPARYLHLGMTSSDVLDTSLALRCVRSIDMILAGWDELVELLAARAVEFKRLACVGRSHGIHAEPTTFGLKILGWHQEFVRAGDRLRQRAREVVGYGQISGARSAPTTPSTRGWRQPMPWRHSDLAVEPVSTQVVPRDRHAEMLAHLAVAAAAIERVATEIRGLQRTEVREVEEPFGKGQKGSSVMPHKRNPIKCENLVGLRPSGARVRRYRVWRTWRCGTNAISRTPRSSAWPLADACILLDFMTHRLQAESFCRHACLSRTTCNEISITPTDWSSPAACSSGLSLPGVIRTEGVRR